MVHASEASVSLWNGVPQCSDPSPRIVCSNDVPFSFLVRIDRRVVTSYYWVSTAHLVLARGYYRS